MMRCLYKHLILYVYDEQTAVCFAKKQKKLLTEKKHKHILKIVKGKGAVSEMMRRLFCFSM